MSEEKFTPGPWEICAGDNYSIIGRNYPKAFSHRFLEDDLGPDIAAIGNRTSDFGEANAQLIAAAPELYEALKELVSAISYRRDFHDRNGPHLSCEDGEFIQACVLEGWNDEIMKARNALAKARGETA